MSSIIKGLQTENNDFQVNVPGYGTMPLEMLKRHVKELTKDFNDTVQGEEFIKAAYRTEQLYNALFALSKAMKAKSKDLDETQSTGTSVGSAGIGGGAGLGIEKSPMEKVIEKPLGETIQSSQGGMGQSYRKFTPKSAGIAEMDSQGYKGHRGDEDPGKGPEKVVKPAKTKDVAKAATKVLNKAMDKAHKKGVAEGAAELLKAEMPTHRHAEKLLAQNGVSKDDPDYHKHLANTINHLRKFGNIDLINKQDVDEEQAPMFTPEEKIVSMNDPRSDGWRVYKAKPAGAKESAIMKGLQTEVKDHEPSKGK